MKLNFRKSLLAGTALIAVGALAVPTAHAADHTLTGDSTWGTTAPVDTVTAADGVDLDSNKLTINDTDQTAIGAITDTNATPTGDLTITSATLNTDITQTIGSVAISGDMLAVTLEADNATVAVTVTGTTTVGSLAVTSTEASDADTLTLTLTGNATVAGATDVTGGNGAGATVTLNVDGALNTFTGLTTITGGGGDATADAYLTLSGAANTFTGGLVLDDSVGQAIVTLDGAAAQTVTGTINAIGATDEGTVNVLAGANAVTFADQIGAVGTEILALNVGNATTGGNAVFNGDVHAATTTVFTQVADDAVADFNGNIVGDLVVTAGNAADELATVTVAGDITGAIALSDDAALATLTLDGTSLQTLTGDITVVADSDGVINANNDVTVIGDLGTAAASLGALNVATGKTFTLQVATGTASAIDTTTLTGTGTLVLDTTTAVATLTGAVAAAADGDGVLKFTGANNAVVTGNVGASGTDVGAIQVTGLADTKGVTLEGDTFANGVAIDATAATDENIVNFGSGANTVSITGDITSAENGEHTLVFNASTAASVTGSIGTAAGAMKLVTLTEGLAIGGDLHSTATVVANTKTLAFNGATAQTVSGLIDGDGAGQGNVLVSNAAGVTFNGAIGTNNAPALITVAGSNADAAATFKAVTSATAIVLGDGADTNTNTVTFDGTTAGFAVTGTVNGTAGDTDNVVITGGNMITTAGIWGAGTALDTLTISGASTKLTAGADITAVTVAIGAGAILDAEDKIIASGGITNAGTLEVGDDIVSANIANSGVINQTGTGGVTGNITGTGTLDIDSDGTYTGNVAGTSADIAVGQTLTFAGANTYSVGTTTLHGAASAGLALDGSVAQTLSGNVVAAADGDGVVMVSDGTGVTTITGNIGTSASRVATFTVAGGGANVVTTIGDLYVDAFGMNDADTLQLKGTAPQVVYGTITGGIITVGDGTAASDVTFNGVVSSVASANVLAAGTARMEANFTTDGLFTNAGDTYVGDGVTLSADDFANTGTIHLEAKDGGTIGTLEAADIGNVDDSSGALTVGDVAFNVTGNINAGTVEIGTSGDATAATFGTITDNSFRYGFALANNAGALDLTITEVAAADIGSTTTNDNTAAVLDTLADSVDAEIAAIVDNFNAAPTQAAANEVLEATASAVDGGAVVAAMGVSNQTSSIADTRLAALRTGDTVATGMSAGNATNGMQFWGQAFGAVADQSDRDGVNGYDADTFGVAVGMESEALGDNVALGFALAYATTDVDSENATTTKTEVDSYQLTLYGDYDLDSSTYISGQIGYSFNDNDSTRHNVGGIAGTNANGNYDSNQLSLRVEGGRSYEMSNDLTITPSVSMAYMNYDADNYTETGAGGANLTVDSDDLSSFEIGVGVEAGWMLEQPDGSVMKPVIRVGVRHDLIGDEFEATNTLAGGGAAFKTQGFDPAQTTFNGGVGMTYFSTENWDFTANYDAEFKSDYLSHAGVLKAAYNF